MAKFTWFRRDSGEVMVVIVVLFLLFGVYVLKLAYELIKMGVTGEFKILADFSGFKLYIASICPGIFLALAVVAIFIWSLPKVLHHQQDQRQ